MIAVLNDGGKLAMEPIIETKASTLLQFIHSSRTSTKVVRAAQNKRLSSLAEGWKSSTVVRFRSGEKYFLDIPLYRPRHCTQISIAFGSLQIGTFG